MTRHLQNARVVCLLLVLGSTVSCRAVNGTLPLSSAWPATPLKRVNTAAQIAAELPALNIPAPDGRTIFIGVHGGNPPTWDDAAWFDPQQWLPYQTIDLQDGDALSQIAYRESVMHVTALYIGRQFPNSITIMIRATVRLLMSSLRPCTAEATEFSWLAIVSEDVSSRNLARDLKQREIAVEALVYIESFWSNGLVPGNVKRAVNFYVPASRAVCRGLESIKAENPNNTEVINIAVPEPRGPYGGLCAEHRNIDSDLRVWQGIFDHVIKKVDLQKPSFTQPPS